MLGYMFFNASSLGYSPANTPHLAPALELDTALVDFSTKVSSRGLPSSINSEADLNCIISSLERDLKALNLWQYYVLEPSREKKAIITSLTSGKVAPWTKQDVQGKTGVELAEILRSQELIIGLGQLGSRFGVHVDSTVSAGLIKAALPDVQDIVLLAEAWIKVVDIVNVPLYREWEEDMQAALENIRNRVKYTRLDVNGPKLKEISKK
jgi:glycogen debranching enzyme